MPSFRPLALARYVAPLLLLATSAGGIAAPDAPLPPVRNGSIPDFLLWSQSEREIGFRSMDQLFPTAPVKRGETIRPLAKGDREIRVSYQQFGQPMDVDSYMEKNHMAGLLILRDGKILLERYRLGFSADQRWTSFSVAKSVTSTLVGAAIRDGYIKSIDDPVTRYIPQMKGGSYDRVSVRQLMMMASGIRWDENVEDFHSDYMRLFHDDFVAPMMDRPQIYPAGTKFHYNTADTNLLGTLVMQATGKPISQYLSEKIWAPYGMEEDAAWLLVHGKETGGACISMRLRDYGRFGEFIRGGGAIDGKPVVADGWVSEATKRQIDTGWGDVGYGYQWWINSDGSFRALGIFGQLIFIDPARKLVVVGLGAWEYPDRQAGYELENAFLAAVQKSADALR